MATFAIIKSEQLNLPEFIANKLKGKYIEIFETPEGLLLKPQAEDAVTLARGCLKGSGLTSEQYMRAKNLEKVLEL